MMKRTLTTALAVFVLAAMPGVATAQETTTDEPAAATTQPRQPTEDQAAARAESEARWVEKVKDRALEAIEKRLATLAELETKINESETVTADHAAVLMQDVRFSVAGLEDLAGEIRAATDLETLRALVPKIFEDYRVYAVVVPKAHLTLGADAVGAIAGRLGEVTVSIADILDRLDEAGFDVAPAEELLTEMIRLVDSAASGAGEVPRLVLDLAPSDYPDSTEVLRSAHETLTEAGSQLRSAGETAHEIGRFIKGLFGDSED